MSDVSKKLISLCPGITEMIFYGSMFAVIKPVLYDLGYKSDFILALIGPSGHLKTTFAKGYALWLKNPEEQEITFRDYGRFKDVIDKIDRLVGQNFLADDLHTARSREGAQRQEERLDILARHISIQQCCAQIILTGESLEDRGIFSCLDRILQIKIPKMNSEKLFELKKSIETIGFDYMPYLALKFAETLVENQKNMEEDINTFFYENSVLDREKDYSLRISQHAFYIKLTEMLYCKYMLNSSEESSCKAQLYEAIESNYNIQRKELLRLRSDEEQDIIVDIYKMLIAPNNNAIEDRKTYLLQKINDYSTGVNFLYSNGKIFITSNAMQIGMNMYLGKTCQGKKISDALHNAGLLEEDSTSRTKKVDNVRHYVINYDLLMQYIQLKESI